MNSEIVFRTLYQMWHGDLVTMYLYEAEQGCTYPYLVMSHIHTGKDYLFDAKLYPFLFQVAGFSSDKRPIEIHQLSDRVISKYDEFDLIVPGYDDASSITLEGCNIFRGAEKETWEFVTTFKCELQITRRL